MIITPDLKINEISVLSNIDDIWVPKNFTMENIERRKAKVKCLSLSFPLCFLAFKKTSHILELLN